MRRSSISRGRLVTATRVVMLVLALVVVAAVAGYVLWEMLSAAIGPDETVGPAG